MSVPHRVVTAAPAFDETAALEQLVNDELQYGLRVSVEDKIMTSPPPTRGCPGWPWPHDPDRLHRFYCHHFGLDPDLLASHQDGTTHPAPDEDR